jgi:outer membrane translocation and assembly module TamA
VRRRVAGNLSGALFYDTGNVELNFEDYLDFADFRHGIGVGIRYLLPIGPLRLDAAWNPDARDGEDEWVIHFAVGLPY